MAPPCLCANYYYSRQHVKTGSFCHCVNLLTYWEQTSCSPNTAGLVQTDRQSFCFFIEDRGSYLNGVGKTGNHRDCFLMMKNHIISRFIILWIDRPMTDVKNLLLTNFSNQFSDKFLLTIVSLWFNDGNHVYKVSHILDIKQSIIYILWYIRLL